ncbi:MAG: chromosome partitioning protein ParA [Tenericutes bacterium HGW-Tenericutes-2]|jgi:ATP-binding protein involved in chromosome partitioning|nr:MAG: chromosome partitioning protein ParA [Tenericutes bacterium HGW-Tenericutes-2]
MTYDDLRKRLEELIDPGFNLPFKAVNGIKKLVIGPTGVAELEMYLKDKTKHEQAVKIMIIKLVKIELGFPGIKIDFFESEFVPEGEKPIKYLAIASGKGGVGKSTVTANLAAALIRQGKKVGIIDADVYGASIPNILKIGIKPLSAAEDERMIPLEKDGIEVISTEFFMPPEKPLMWRGPMLGKMLIHFFTGVKWQDDIDLILIDLPPGTGDVALDVKTYVPKSKILVVTTPHVNASHVAVKAGIGAQNIGHEVIGVVENMSYYFNICSSTREFIFGQGGGDEVARKLGVKLFGQIPIGQPQNGDFLYTGKEEAGKIYNDLALKVMKEMDI